MINLGPNANKLLEHIYQCKKKTYFADYLVIKVSPEFNAMLKVELNDCYIVHRNKTDTFAGVSIVVDYEQVSDFCVVIDYGLTT